MRRGKHGGPEISFRALRRDDIPQLEQLQISLFPVKYAPIFYQKLFHEGYFCIVALSDDQQIVGVASARICVEENEKWWKCCSSVRGYIMTIGVDDTFRGQGIGSVLLERICTLLIQNRLGNEAAIQFYHKNGFLLEEEVQHYYLIDGRNYNSLRFGKSPSQTSPSSLSYSSWKSWLPWVSLCGGEVPESGGGQLLFKKVDSV